MYLAEMSIAVIMQRRAVDHPWADHAWSVAAVHPSCPADKSIVSLDSDPACQTYMASGLSLTLYRDENDGYFENWVAPEPKVFVMWHMEQDVAAPVLASVSYGEGTRMLDSGEFADGVPMHHDIHAWLGAYLQAHYHPKPRRGRQHG